MVEVGDAAATGSVHPGIRGVLFDIDHTLVDTAASFAAALSASLLPLLPAGTGVEDLLGPWGKDASGWYRAYTRGELGYEEQRHRRIDELLMAHGVHPLGEDAFTELNREFDDAFAAAWRPFPDAVRVVADLADAGVPMGAVTNAGGDLQRRKLAAVGLLDRVPLLVSVDTYGVGKPDPRVFREGARLLGLPASQVAYVGDEPDVDADAATRAGLVGVHLHRAGDDRFAPCAPDQRGHCEVGDLTGLLRALALPWSGTTR